MSDHDVGKRCRNNMSEKMSYKMPRGRIISTAEEAGQQGGLLRRHAGREENDVEQRGKTWRSNNVHECKKHVS